MNWSGLRVLVYFYSCFDVKGLGSDCTERGEGGLGKDGVSLSSSFSKSWHSEHLPKTYLRSWETPGGEPQAFIYQEALSQVFLSLYSAIFFGHQAPLFIVLDKKRQNKGLGNKYKVSLNNMHSQFHGQIIAVWSLADIWFSNGKGL